MTWLFLHVCGSDGALTEDPDGEEFDTLDHAKVEARAAARELMADALRADQPIGLDRTIEIANEHGSIVASVRFRDAFKP
jgi:hypothetical protein